MSETFQLTDLDAFTVSALKGVFTNLGLVKISGNVKEKWLDIVRKSIVVINNPDGTHDAATVSDVLKVIPAKAKPTAVGLTEELQLKIGLKNLEVHWLTNNINFKKYSIKTTTASSPTTAGDSTSGPTAPASTGIPGSTGTIATGASTGDVLTTPLQIPTIPFTYGSSGLLSNILNPSPNVNWLTSQEHYIDTLSTSNKNVDTLVNSTVKTELNKLSIGNAFIVLNGDQTIECVYGISALNTLKLLVHDKFTFAQVIIVFQMLLLCNVYYYKHVLYIFRYTYLIIRTYTLSFNI